MLGTTSPSTCADECLTKAKVMSVKCPVSQPRNNIGPKIGKDFALGGVCGVFSAKG